MKQTGSSSNNFYSSLTNLTLKSEVILQRRVENCVSHFLKTAEGLLPARTVIRNV